MGGVDPADEFDEVDEYQAAHAPRAEPRPVDRWRRNTASGALAAALARGLQQVFDPERKDTIGIEQEAPSRPEDPDHPDEVELRFDPLSSRGTSVVVHRRDPDERPGDEPQP